MKYTLFAIAFLSLQIQAAAQGTDPVQTTNIEKFQGRTSSLILKEYIDISQTRTMTVQVVKMSVLPERKESVSGVLISWGTTSIGTFQQAGQAYLDGDEVDRVVSGIDAMLKMHGGTIPQNYTELELSTKGGFKLTLFPSKTAWNIAMERHGHRQYIYAEDLLKISESLTTAKTKL